MYHFTDGGLRNVWLTNGYTESHTKYGKAVSIQDLDGLVEAICQALAKKPSKLTGVEFRYIRTHLLLSQKSLGQMMGYTEQAVAKWEKTGKVPKAADKLLRLTHAGKHNGNEKIGSLIECLNSIERIQNTRIIVSESKHKWTSKVEVQPEEDLAMA